MGKTYEQMHSGLHWSRGKASEHPCSGCGGDARDWAYMHNAAEELTDPRGRKYSESFEDYSPMCRSCHLKWDLSKDPGWSNRLSNFAEQSPLRREWAKKGREVIANMRRKCDGCSLETSPGALGTHQRATGHVGWSEL